MTDVEWNKIKNDYITSGKSCRVLSEEYPEATYSSIKSHCWKGKWKEAREKQLARVEKRTAEKTAEKIAERTANDYVDRQKRIYLLSDKLTDKIELAIEQLDSFISEDGEVHKIGYVDTQRLRQVVSSLKDIRDMTAEQDTATEIKVDFGSGGIYAK